MVATEERTSPKKASYHGDRGPVVFHLRKHTRDALYRVCERENRTLSSVGDEIVNSWLVQHGQLPAAPDPEPTPAA